MVGFQENKVSFATQKKRFNIGVGNAQKWNEKASSFRGLTI
jgi:hypothetical protein